MVSANRLLTHFERRGGSGKVLKPFSEHSSNVQDFFRDTIELVDDEVPVIACFHSQDSWTLLSTKRLLCRKFSENIVIPLSSIRDATLELHRQGLGPGSGKKDMKLLKVITTSGASFEIDLEPGGPFFGFLNVMKLIAQTRPHEEDK